MSRNTNANPARPSGQHEPPPDGSHDPNAHDPAEPNATTPPADAERQQTAFTAKLPPSADPANWVDHED